MSAAELRKHGVRLRLQEQPFQVLAALLENPGEVVTREDLIRRLWPDGTVVDFDRGLNAAVTRLRQALSDSAEAPRYVETVARQGISFPGASPQPEPGRNACGSTRCKTLLGLACGGDHCGARNRGSLVVFGKTQDDF